MLTSNTATSSTNLFSLGTLATIFSIIKDAILIFKGTIDDVIPEIRKKALGHKLPSLKKAKRELYEIQQVEAQHNAALHLARQKEVHVNTQNAMLNIERQTMELETTQALRQQVEALRAEIQNIKSGGQSQSLQQVQQEMAQLRSTLHDVLSSQAELLKSFRAEITQNKAPIAPLQQQGLSANNATMTPLKDATTTTPSTAPVAPRATAAPTAVA